MPNQSVEGYIAVQDELGNLYDMRPIDIALEGEALRTMLPIAVIGGLIVVGLVAIGTGLKRKNKAKTQTS